MCLCEVVSQHACMHGHPGEHLSYLMLSNLITCVLAAYREHHKPSNCKIYSRCFKFEGTKGTCVIYIPHNIVKQFWFSVQLQRCDKI